MPAEPLPHPTHLHQQLTNKGQKIWSDHIRSTPCMSFDVETVDKALIAATLLPKEEPGEMETQPKPAKTILIYHD